MNGTGKSKSGVEKVQEQWLAPQFLGAELQSVKAWDIELEHIESNLNSCFQQVLTLSESSSNLSKLPQEKVYTLSSLWLNESISPYMGLSQPGPFSNSSSFIISK